MVAALVIVNLVMGSAGAYALARRFRDVGDGDTNIYRLCGIFISVYFVECVSMILGMGVPVFSIFLSFVWAAIFGMRLSNWRSRDVIRKTSYLLSLYTSLPAMSFITVPIAVLSSGGDITSVDAGYRFGIPRIALVPQPMRTILGFYATLAVVSLILKTIITVGGIALVGRGRTKSARSGDRDDRSRAGG
jgi:CDP-diglyceride synthetase